MILDAFLLKSCSKAAPAALGGCGGLGQVWEALAELWEALYIEKLPINRPSGRYVTREYSRKHVLKSNVIDSICGHTHMTTFAIYHIGPLRSNVLSNTSALNFIQI